MTTENKADVYDIINERITAMIEAGTNPWRKPWNAAAQKPPQNLMSRKPYRGLNILMLGLAPYESPYWLTFNQARAAGGTVKKGEKSSLAVFWKLYDTADRTNPDNKKRVPVLRYYRVFNAEQCENVPAPVVDVPTFDHNPIDAAAYLDSWRKLIKQEKRAVVVAAGAAQKAVDYITGTKPETITEEGESGQ